MDQFRFKHPKERHICQFKINGISCGVHHRNSSFQLCKYHRMKMEAKTPILHIIENLTPSPPTPTPTPGGVTVSQTQSGTKEITLVIKFL